jgi:hypothetical protein
MGKEIFRSQSVRSYSGPIHLIKREKQVRDLMPHIYPTGQIFGADARSPRYLKQWMENAGFVDVEEHILKLPVGPWPREPRLKQVGLFEMVNMTEGIQGLTIMLLTRCLKWTATEVELFLADVRKDVRNKKIHSYYHLYVGLQKKQNWMKR